MTSRSMISLCIDLLMHFSDKLEKKNVYAIHMDDFFKKKTKRFSTPNFISFYLERVLWL